MTSVVTTVKKLAPDGGSDRATQEKCERCGGPLAENGRALFICSDYSDPDGKKTEPDGGEDRAPGRRVGTWWMSGEEREYSGHFCACHLTDGPIVCCEKCRPAHPVAPDGGEDRATERVARPCDRCGHPSHGRPTEDNGEDDWCPRDDCQCSGPVIREPAGGECEKCGGPLAENGRALFICSDYSDPDGKKTEPDGGSGRAKPLTEKELAEIESAFSGGVVVSRLVKELRAARAERDAMQRRAEAAESDWKTIAEQRNRLARRVAELEAR